METFIQTMKYIILYEFFNVTLKNKAELLFFLISRFGGPLVQKCANFTI